MEVKKILLVDDSEPFNFLTRATLKSLLPDTVVEEAINGQIALKLMSKANECPDVVLLDINMPVMDGFEFLEELEKKKRCKDVKIFMLTSSNLSEDKTTALSHKSVKGYLYKPLTAEHVKQILASFS